VLWRAFSHQFGYTDGYRGPQMLEVSPGATWSKVSPLSSYKETSRKRDPEAGAHLTFHNLSDFRNLSEQRRLFEKGALLFAREHGLLGLFHEYCSDRVAPPGKFWVAPNAVIEDGKMYRIDPASEGRERLETFLYEKYGRSAKTGQKIRLTLQALALPEELEFYPTSRFGSEFPGAEVFGGPPGGGVLTWEDVEERYGVVALLDADADRGVSVVPTRESLASWEYECANFVRARYDPEIAHGLNERIAGVTPYASFGRDGELERGWRCRSLLQAMYLMVYLDVTGGKSVRRCKRPDCRRHYRLGPQESDYCSARCTNWATTRRSRGLWS
jgi:hypothetical protein